MNNQANKAGQHRGVGRVAGRQRVTMHDIARVAGCSQTTVSLVLNKNDSVKISEDTKQRVLDAANTLGYAMPSQLRKPQDSARRPAALDGTIAFVVDDLASSPEMVNAFNGVKQAVRDTGNLVLLAETQNDPEVEPRTLRYFLDRQVAGIIYATVFTRRVVVPEILRQTATPVLLLNCFCDDLSFPAVIPGEVAAGHTATNALIKAGHKRIATITGEPFMECAAGRTTGYRNALASADIPFDEDLVIEGNWLPSAGYAATRELMDLHSPPTAIFCQNDRMAIGCYEALKELGLSIPEDISVIGFDDDETARHLSPPLTSMILPTRAMGRWVVEQLFHGPTDGQRHPLVKLECELVERDSISEPKRRT
ncbi:LacI family DNA-binding transcriptional regulator [Ruegeria sp. HKCCA0235A]|uniref:LacI family DNA-binding transcriptional regulator n=1 Tax=Ruegeria sp. HKCCA0235A TaxID=2682998 RepID=UPI0020C52FB8|nr:LacI family DNA-binding transcriptional regulator [Ruegeria sp. HKCCA0235A]